MNNKGFIQDGLYLVVVIFMLAMFSLVAYISLNLLNSSIQADDSIDPAAKAHLDTLDTRFPAIFDWAFILLIVGVLIGSMIVSYIVPANPLFFFFLIFFVIVIGAFAGFMSNAWDGATDDGGVVSAAESAFPMTKFVMDNYLVFTIVNLMLMSVVFYAKPEGVF